MIGNKMMQTLAPETESSMDRRMQWLRTPSMNQPLWRLLNLTVLTAPVVVALHFFNRLMRGDYPSDADSIGIPIFMFMVFVFPITLSFLKQGLRRYTPNVFLLTWKRSQFWRSLVWTLFAIWPVGLMSVGMLMEGIDGRQYGVSVFFLLHLYCILVLRASILGCNPSTEVSTQRSEKKEAEPINSN